MPRSFVTNGSLNIEALYLIELKATNSQFSILMWLIPSSLSSFFCVSLLLTLSLLISQNGNFTPFAQASKRRVHIPDDLDDVIDDEEDETWKKWGEKSTPSSDLDQPPPDFSNMDLSQIQAEMMKRQSGPAFGFVKLQLGVRRSRDDVAEIAMKWTNVLRTGALGARFMGVDLNTIMVSMQRGQDTEELREFVLNQPEAYEIKIGDQIFRRPGDPPIEEVVEKLRGQKDTADTAKNDEL